MRTYDKESARNPHGLEPITTFITRDEWELERAHRQERSSMQRDLFSAWWDAYKIELTKGPFDTDLSYPEKADEAEREYFERRIRMHETIEEIWRDFPVDAPTEPRPRPGSGK